MSRSQYAQGDCEEWTPPCPACKSRQTSFCSITDDGPVYLCSPCCEAFYHEPAHDLRARIGRRLLLGTVVFCVAVVVAAIALTPSRPAPNPPKYQQYAPPRVPDAPAVSPRW